MERKKFREVDYVTEIVKRVLKAFRKIFYSSSQAVNE